MATDAYTSRGLAVIFTDDEVRYVTKESFTDIVPRLEIKYENTKKFRDKLWTAPQMQLNEESIQVNSIVHNEINANYTGWWHATLGSPTISALLSAIQRGALRNLPRLTTKLVRQNTP